MNYKYFTDKIDIECCHYNEDCNTDYKAIEKIIISLFNDFITEDGIVPPKKNTLDKLYLAINPCGYTSECGNNNIEEVINELYNYFDNSLSKDFEYLTVPKAVELGLINYDNQVRFQTVTPYVEMDELWVYEQSFRNVVRQIDEYFDRGWKEQLTKAQDLGQVLIDTATKKEIIEKMLKSEYSSEIKVFVEVNNLMIDKG